MSTTTVFQYGFATCEQYKPQASLLTLPCILATLITHLSLQRLCLWLRWGMHGLKV